VIGESQMPLSHTAPRPRHATALRVALTVGLCLAGTQAALLALTSLRRSLYLPYVAPHYYSIWLVSTAILFGLLIAVAIAILAALNSPHPRRFLHALLIAAPAGLLFAASCGWWGDLAMGVGQSDTVAQLGFHGALYRLDYTAPGEPPWPSLYIYECRPSPLLCRQIGTITDIQVYRPLPALQLRATDGGFAIIVGDSPVALFADGVLTCAKTESPPSCRQ
jgi:hypothetical protein